MAKSHQSQARALVVEDDADTAYLVRFLLERQGFDVDHRADGREALEAMEGMPPDIVIMDIMLPYHDGLELVGRMRQIPAWEHTPVLVLSVKSRESDIVRALDVGADDYMTKPFQTDELLARVRRFLRRRRA